MMKIFMEIGGGQKYIQTLPPNILEGNGVVFENFTINHGNGGGWSKQIIHTPPQIFLKVMELCRGWGV